MEKKREKRLMTAGVIAAACLFYAINGGIRSNYGLIRGAISANSGVGYEQISFILAVAQLSFGFMQPVFGILAMKRSNGFVLCCGSVLAAAGMLLLPFCQAQWNLMIALGFLMPVGFAAFAFGIIMGAITPLLGEQRAAAVSGLVSASSGLGSIVLAPVLQGVQSGAGIWGAVLAMAAPTVFLFPVALWLTRCGREEAQGEQTGAQETSLAAVLSGAMKERSYLFLMLGFFTCGFHMAIVETHLYPQITSYGFSDEITALAFSVYGVAAMLGSVASGLLGGRFPMQKVLGCIYGSRVIWITGFLLLPKTLVTVFLFAILVGLTGAATVPPTSGLVGRLFGPARLGTLFGMVFVAHQVGSFFSSWLGGVCLAVTGDYTLIWCASAVLSALAAAVSFRIRTE